MSNVSENPVRSPSYPVWSLADAVTAVRKIEAQYRSAKVDREIAAKVIGYSGLSGPANKALAALAQFGLVERAGKGEMRVTERARAILHPDTENEKRSELLAAALEPPLFRELRERWPDMTPPYDGVESYLNRKGFNRTAIRPAAKAYLETLLYLEEAGASESHGGAPSEGAEGRIFGFKPEDTAMQAAAIIPPPPSISPAVVTDIADALGGQNLNRIAMNIQGDKVHINGLLDMKGLLDLEKKLAALKILLQVQDVANDTGDDGAGDD